MKRPHFDVNRGGASLCLHRYSICHQQTCEAYGTRLPTP